MTLVQLKDLITNNILPSDFMIFVRKDSHFLVNQYTKALSRIAQGGVNKISSIYEPLQSSLSLLTANPDALFILTTDTFNERAENYSQFENTIVICDQIDKSIAPAVENFTIKFPELTDWQIFDYIKIMYPNLTDEEITWLIKVTDKSIERIINELDKSALFEANEQKEILSSIMYGAQSDLYKVDFYTIVDALIDGNCRVLYEFLSHNDYESLDPVALANSTFAKLKNIILITQNPKISAEDCGITLKYYKRLKSNYHSLNLEAIKAKLKFLARFDLDLKTSKLDLSKRDTLNYLINNLVYKIIS